MVLNTYPRVVRGPVGAGLWRIRYISLVCRRHAQSVKRVTLVGYSLERLQSIRGFISPTRIFEILKRRKCKLLLIFAQLAAASHAYLSAQVGDRETNDRGIPRAADIGTYSHVSNYSLPGL